MSPLNDGPAPDRDEEAALWCLDLEDGFLSPERQRAFDHWHADPANAEAFQRAAGAWDIVEMIGGTPEVVQMRSDALDAYRRGTLARGRRPVRWRAIGWGASGAIAASLAFILSWSMLPDQRDFHSAIGERRVAMLEDGSRLSLDGDSEVQARFDTRGRALILTRGRARFDVAHNPLRPFTVAVGDKLVVATGTSFSVEKIGAEVHVVLFEGHVSVLDGTGAPVALAGSGKAADEVLAPGDELTVPAASAGGAIVAPTDAAMATAWQRGQVSFDDAPLSLAVERMNRYLREPLVVGNARAASVRVTGVFDGGDAAGFLDAIRRLSGVQAEHKGGKVLLTRD